MADPRLEELLRSISANEALKDAAIRHAHFVEGFKVGTQNRILAFLNRDVYPDLIAQVEHRLSTLAKGEGLSLMQTKRYFRMIRAVDEIIKLGMRESRLQLVKQELMPLARQEAALTMKQLQGSTPLQLNLHGIDPATLRQVVVARPFQGKLLREWYSGLSSSTQQAVRQQINIGLVQGESIPTIVRRLKGTRAAQFADGILQTSRRNVTSVVRTAVNHTVTATREAAYAANDDIIKGVQYVATLDGRTTFICMSLDGQVFPINEGERPPQHMQCRSTTTPILKSWKELGINLKEVPPGTRASMNGQVPATTNYDAWLRTQPQGFQDQVLGPGRAELFRGGLSVDKFVNDAGKALTLEQLAAV